MDVARCGELSASSLLDDQLKRPPGGVEGDGGLFLAIFHTGSNKRHLEVCTIGAHDGRLSSGVHMYCLRWSHLINNSDIMFRMKAYGTSSCWEAGALAFVTEILLNVPESCRGFIRPLSR
jgi:hypothetical protein